MPTEFIVGKIPDRSIIELFDAIMEKFGKSNHSYNMADLSFQDPPEILRNAKYPSYAINAGHVSTADDKFTIHVSRNHNSSPYFDLIRVNTATNANRPTPQQFLEMEELVRAKVKFPDASIQFAKDNQLTGILEKEVSSLASLHQKLIADAIELRQKLDSEDAERRKALEARTLEVETDLATKENDSITRIAHERSELDAKLKEFDFSDHMRARRQLREQITGQVQEFLVRDPSTFQSSRKLLTVVLICIAGACASGLLAFESFQSFITLAGARTLPAVSEQLGNSSPPPLSGQMSSKSQSGISEETSKSAPKNMATVESGSVIRDADHTFLLWMLALRGLVLSAVTVGFLAYLITFLRKSYESEVTTLRDLQRYGMDINRASWVIETAMEMTTKEGAQLPEIWVEGACAGLFQNGRGDDKEVGSLAALGAVMGLGPEVSIGPNGASLKLQPKAAKKAANEG
ncbi:hypothetical protein [Mesorhizobium sp. CA12]|uniref:hypothetical protein n=1 Tax=Mesorhizobium sp. CA12 TaxID=2876644 RepID=UPI001CCBCC3D|nr:hypothetical protein [Mesorhizobium sp. CA12]MBZ9862741.1 hypothetical protein [Mesorhizobium sp. CA12]